MTIEVAVLTDGFHWEIYDLSVSSEGLVADPTGHGVHVFVGQMDQPFPRMAEAFKSHIPPALR